MKNLLFAVRPLALDLMATFFFIGVSALTHNPVLATGVAMAVGITQVAVLKLRGRPVAALQWMSLGLVLVFGSATLLTHNARFMMFKPSIIYVVVGAVMLQRGWMLRYLPPAAQGRMDAQMVRWGYVWSGLMFATAALNLGFALLASFAVWSAFIAVFPAVSKIALFAVQYLLMRATAIRHLRRERAAAEPQAAAA